MAIESKPRRRCARCGIAFKPGFSHGWRCIAPHIVVCEVCWCEHQACEPFDLNHAEEPKRDAAPYVTWEIKHRDTLDTPKPEPEPRARWSNGPHKRRNPRGNSP